MADEIHWAKDFQSGIEQAIKENKPVIFIVSSTKCKYCLLLDRTTLHDTKVIKALNENFIPIRSWVDKGDYVPSVIRQNTPGLPGIWFLYSNGDPMYQPLLGYIKTKNFLDALGIVKTEFDKNKNGK
jgi:thioredoxin-related protein